MPQVHGIARARVVDVVTRFVEQQAIIRSVIDAPERKGRPTFIPFRSVVVNYVEDDLQACIMEMSDHFHRQSQSWVTRLEQMARDYVEPRDEAVTVQFVTPS
jgi:hypothetical protein